MRRNATFLLTALLTISGCATEPEDNPLTGTWTGSVTEDGTLVTFTWELRESGGVIAGSASYTLDPVTVTGDVTGVYDHPDVRMTLVIFFGNESVTFRWVGTRTSDNVMSGVLHDVDGGQTSMTLRRA